MPCLPALCPSALLGPPCTVRGPQLHPLDRGGPHAFLPAGRGAFYLTGARSPSGTHIQACSRVMISPSSFLRSFPWTQRSSLSFSSVSTPSPPNKPLNHVALVSVACIKESPKFFFGNRDEDVARQGSSRGLSIPPGQQGAKPHTFECARSPDIHAFSREQTSLVLPQRPATEPAVGGPACGCRSIFAGSGPLTEILETMKRTLLREATYFQNEVLFEFFFFFF